MNRAAATALTGFGVCLVIGYGLGEFGSGKNSSGPSPEIPKINDQAIGRAPALQSVSLSMRSPMPTVVRPERREQLARKADQLALTDAERELARALDETPTGSALRRMLVSGNHSKSFPESEELGLQTLQELKRDPQTSAKEILRALDIKMISANEFAGSRAALLVSLSQMPGHEAETQAAAMRELIQNPPEARPDPEKAQTQEELDAALSTSPVTAAPLIAHALFMEAAKDIVKSLQATVEGIAAQKDAGIRNSLGEQFLNKYPDSKNQLIGALSERGLSIDLSKWSPT